MKFQSVEAFHYHLIHSFPDQWAKIFLLILSSENERQVEVTYIQRMLEKKDPNVRILSLKYEDKKMEKIQQEFQSLSLWAPLTLVIWDSFDDNKLGAPDLEVLGHIPSNCLLILGASSFKPVLEFYQKRKKEMVVLDLSQEKAWEKQKRIQSWIKESFQIHKKTITDKATVYLSQQLGLDQGCLAREIDKILCFVGEKSAVDLHDLQAICSDPETASGWQLAEKIVWEQPSSLSDKIFDPQFHLILIGQIRHHLHIGSQLAELQEEHVDLTIIKQQFPHMRPQQLEKYIQHLCSRGKSFFQQGLILLSDLEFDLKSSNLNPALLFEIFQCKLYADAIFTSKSLR